MRPKFIVCVLILACGCATTKVERAGRELPSVAKLAKSAKFDVPIVLNERVLAWVDYFQNAEHTRFAQYLSRSGRYLPMMRQVFKKYALPQDLVYIALIESGFNNNAYSRSHAAGQWQFIRGTGKRYGLDINYWVDERRDPRVSTVAAARYLRDLFDEFGDWYLAFAAYNAGEGKIRKALARTGAHDFWEMIERDRRFLRAETKDYVPKFIAATIVAKSPQRFGFGNVVYEDPLEFETVKVDSQTDIYVIARCADVSPEEIANLNPHLIKGTTPPTATDYEIVLPKGTAKKLLVALADVPPDKRVTVTRHQLRRGESLYKVARRYGVPLKTLLAANNLRDSRGLKPGTAIVIPLGTARKAPIAPTSRYVASKKVETVKRQGTEVALSERIEVGPAEPKSSMELIESHPLIAGSPSTIETEPVRPIQKEYSYMVKTGDTLWDIANQFGVSVRDLINLNSLGKRAKIWPGDVIKIR